ncbi:MAG: lysylphosphatidylglycerol synthase domain-containing protein, partial [Chloroflexota bacterium]|nr:lysylphosphatidylglycerol synthase domain-containing protein [Chloroflexota bacterium]
FASAFAAGFQTFSKAKWSQRCIVLALSVLVWATTYAMYYFVFSSFSLALPFYAPFFVMAAVNLGTVIPVAAGGIGTFQALVVVSLALFGINRSAALTSSIVLHGVVSLPVIMLGLFFLYGVRQVDQFIPIRGESVNK